MTSKRFAADHRRPETRWALLAAGLSLAVLALPILHSDALADDAAETAAGVLSQPDYQSDFPQQPNTPSKSDTSTPSVDDGPSSPPIDPADLAPPDVPTSGSGSGIDLRYVLLAAAILGFFALAGYLILRMPRPARPSSTEPAAVIAKIRAETAPAPTRQPGPLDEAEQLAAAGRFNEAIHLVLFRFLAELRHRTNLTIADSLTSREILRREALPHSTREALGVVIGAVELCHFGGRRADEKLFRHCADAYLAATAWRLASSAEGA